MKMMKLLPTLPIPNMVSLSLSCFHLHIPTNPNINLIHSDGHVTIFNRPVKVSDLILQFPKHSICRTDSFYIGRKIQPLSGHRHLKLGRNYFLLPNHFFHSVLSFLTFASFFSAAASAAAVSASSRPFDIQQTPSGSLRIRLSDDFLSGLLEQGNSQFQSRQKQSNPEFQNRPKQSNPEFPNRVKQSKPALPVGKICTTVQLAKDYTQLATRRQWKPKLDTIRERKKKGRAFRSFKAKIRIRSRV